MKFKRYCACGGERIAEGLNREMYTQVAAQWNSQHDKPECYSISGIQFALMRLGRWSRGEQ